MPRPLPSSEKQARRHCAEVMAELGFEETGPPTRGYAKRYTGASSGLWVVVDVAFGAAMGAASFDLRTAVNLDPALGLGLSLQCGERRLNRDDAHLPEAWRAFSLEGMVSAVRSTEPAYTRAILEAVPKPNLTMNHFGGPTSTGVNLVSLEDGEANFFMTQVPSAQELVQHVTETASWCAQLVQAAQTFVPDAHEMFPDETWQAITRQHGGRVDLPARRYRQRLHEGELTLAAVWRPRQSYELVGGLRWPALSFEELSLQVKAARSWLRRLFATDIEVGDAELDDTFLIDAEPQDRLSALLTRDVRKATLRLATVTTGLHIGVEGADFVVGSDDVHDAVVPETVDAALTLLHAVAATRDRSIGAYR